MEKRISQFLAPKRLYAFDKDKQVVYPDTLKLATERGSALNCFCGVDGLLVPPPYAEQYEQEEAQVSSSTRNRARKCVYACRTRTTTVATTKNASKASSVLPPTMRTNVAPNSHGTVTPRYGQGQTCGLFWKTQLCSKWKATGKCPKKNQCSFAHSLAELRDLPDLRCTKWCRRVFRGLPCEDLECPYAHSRDQLRCNSHQLLAFKTALCKFHVKGICLSGEACRFAHTLKELRSPDNAVKEGVERGDGRMRQQYRTRQAHSRQSPSNCTASANRSCGVGSRISTYTQKTGCRHGDNRGGASLSKGGGDCKEGGVPPKQLRERETETESSGIHIKQVAQRFASMKSNQKGMDPPRVPNNTVGSVKELSRPVDGSETAPLMEGQHSFDHKHDKEDAQGISTCEATETLPGITSSSASRTSSRSSSKSSGLIAATTELQPVQLRLVDAPARPLAPNSQEGSATEHGRKSDNRRNIRRLTDKDDGVNIQAGVLAASSPRRRSAKQRSKDSKGSKEAVHGGENGGCLSLPWCFSESASVFVPSSTSAVTVTDVPTCRVYTKAQLLAAGATFERTQHRSAELYEGGTLAVHAHKITDGLTIRVVSCDETSPSGAVSAGTRSQFAQAPTGPTEEALDSGQQRRSYLGHSEMIASRAENQDYQQCSGQASCTVTGLAASAVPGAQGAPPYIPDHDSSRNSSSSSVPLVGFQQRAAAQKVSATKIRVSPNPAVGSGPRSVYTVQSQLGTATREAASPSNVSLPLHRIDVHGSTPMPAHHPDIWGIDPPTGRVPPAVLLLYTQALEAAVIAAAMYYRSLEEVRTDEKTRVTSYMNTRCSDPADFSSCSYVDTWRLHAKSMALVTLAALCRLALLPPQQPQFFEQQASIASSLSVLGSQHPLELATIMQHLATLTSQLDLSPRLPDDNKLIPDAEEGAKRQYCNAVAAGLPSVQADGEDGARVTNQTEIQHRDQPPQQPEQPFQMPHVQISAETAGTEEQCTNIRKADSLDTRDIASRSCPRCLFLAALREHPLLTQHNDVSSTPQNPLRLFFERSASGWCSNTVATSGTDSFISSATDEEEEKQHPPPPELVASLLRYVQVASDLQQARAF